MSAQVHPIHPALGVEVTGLDVSGRLDDDEIRFLRDAFDRHGLVLVRDVELDRARQAYLCELLRGDHVPSEAEAAGLSDQQGTFWISNKRENAAAPFGSLMFHSDSMWSEFPFDVLCLYGVDVQPPVAPTLFASARHAWEVLPEDLKESVRDLQAANVSAAEYLPDRRRQAFDGQLLSLHREAVPTTLWPVARTHPRTGQTLLYLSQGTTQGLVGLDPEESEDLIERLFAYLYAPENVLAHEWRNGDLVIWDNHSVQHGRGEVTVDGPARTLRKVALPIVESTIASSIIEAYEPLETGS